MEEMSGPFFNIKNTVYSSETDEAWLKNTLNVACRRTSLWAWV